MWITRKVVAFDAPFNPYDILRILETWIFKLYWNFSIVKIEKSENDVNCRYQNISDALFHRVKDPEL